MVLSFQQIANLLNFWPSYRLPEEIFHILQAMSTYAWTAIVRITTIWKSDLAERITT